MKLTHDGFARRDTFQKLSPDWFFHRRVYAKFRESCSRYKQPAVACAVLSAQVPRVQRSAEDSGLYRTRSPLQRATDSRGNGAKTRNELGENLRCKRLVPVALGHL